MKKEGEEAKTIVELLPYFFSQLVHNKITLISNILREEKKTTNPRPYSELIIKVGHSHCYTRQV